MSHPEPGAPVPRPSAAASGGSRLPLEPMDPRMTSIQPGGGVVMRLELLWGSLRRCWLKAFRRRYVERMRQCRRGDRNPCPHEVLDPRDLKFHRNQEGWHWAPQDDPFAWRERLPFVRVGLAELFVGWVITFGGAALAAWGTTRAEPWGAVAWIGWLAVAALVTIGILVTWFFRNPRRPIPHDAGVVVAPADGKIAEIREIEQDEFLGGPAVLIGIFLSIFNVHINRTPVAARVIGVRYREGKFLNALRPESVRENEQVAVFLQEQAAPYRRMIVRQITGAIARRIVCWLKSGDEPARGEPFGMIKLGSRTELVLPREEGLEIAVQVGQHVQAGSCIVARYTPVGDPPSGGG